MAEDLKYDYVVKYGLSLEQGRKKVDEINVGKVRQEETVRQLKAVFYLIRQGRTVEHSLKQVKDVKSVLGQLMLKENVRGKG